MTLIVEDGTGKTDAEAYESVANADAYWVLRGTAPAAWIDGAASASLHLEAQPADTETITIDGKVYTFQTTLTDVDGNILIGSSLSVTQANLVGAINLSGDSADGRYADSMAIHSTVSAADFSSNVMVATAKTGGTAGNSIAVSEACAADDIYWVTSTLENGTDTKEQWMRMGAEWLDLEYDAVWRGQRSTELQALHWPRTGAYDNDDYLIDSDEMPVNLKRANIEAALRVAEATNHELLPDDSSSGATITRKLVKAGPVTQDITYGGGGSSSDASKAYPKIEALVAHLIHPPGRIRRA